MITDDKKLMMSDDNRLIFDVLWLNSQYSKSVRAFKSKESLFSLFLEILLFFLLISLASLYRQLFYLFIE